MAVPDRLRIREGRLSTRGSRSPEAYLRRWQRKYDIPDGAPVCVIARADLQKLADELQMLRELNLCA